jgi:hypothetical protein
VKLLTPLEAIAVDQGTDGHSADPSLRFSNSTAYSAIMGPLSGIADEDLADVDDPGDLGLHAVLLAKSLLDEIDWTRCTERFEALSRRIPDIARRRPGVSSQNASVLGDGGSSVASATTPAGAPDTPRHGNPLAWSAFGDETVSESGVASGALPSFDGFMFLDSVASMDEDERQTFKRELGTFLDRLSTSRQGDS